MSYHRQEWDDTLIRPPVKLCSINEVMARDRKGDPDAAVELFASQDSALAMEHHRLAAGQLGREQEVECCFKTDGQGVFRIAVQSCAGYVPCHASGSKKLTFAAHPVKSDWTERPYPLA